MINKLKMSRINIIRTSFLSIGITFLIASYLCFVYVIPIPLFDICGSACEYWWSWIIDFPPQGICIMICVPRNALYKPLFVVGALMIVIEILLEFYQLIHKVQG